MFHGLTMVNFDGQTQNQMMVRPWSDGQTVAGDWLCDLIKIDNIAIDDQKPIHQPQSIFIIYAVTTANQCFQKTKWPAVQDQENSFSAPV